MQHFDENVISVPIEGSPSAVASNINPIDYINFDTASSHVEKDDTPLALSTNFFDFIKAQEEASSKEKSKEEFHNFVNQSEGKVRVSDDFNPMVCKIENVSTCDFASNTISNGGDYGGHMPFADDKVECFDPRGDISVYET